MTIKEPLFFERNRVGRVYTGGMLFNGLFGDAPEDNFEPEEWIASGVTALNEVSKGPKEGVSKIKGFFNSHIISPNNRWWWTEDQVW